MRLKISAENKLKSTAWLSVLLVIDTPLSLISFKDACTPRTVIVWLSPPFLSNETPAIRDNAWAIFSSDDLPISSAIMESEIVSEFFLAFNAEFKLERTPVTSITSISFNLFFFSVSSAKALLATDAVSAMQTKLAILDFLNSFNMLFPRTNVKPVLLSLDVVAK